MLPRLFQLVVTACVGGIALVGLQASSAAAVPAPPHIAVHPDSLMIGTSMALQGTRFAPDHPLTVEECSAKEWIVPENPCATSNVAHVHTDGAGRFRHSMIAEVCPGVVPVPGFAERCYVGVPTPVGVDQVVLVAAAPVTVTGP